LRRGAIAALILLGFGGTLTVGCSSKSENATPAPAGPSTTASTPGQPAPPQPGKSSVNPDQIMKEIKDDKNPGVGMNGEAGGK